MIRNFKALGLALVAMLALGATLAASASAVTGHLTSPSATAVVGTATDENDSFTAFGNQIQCHAEYKVEKTGTTTGEALPLPAASATVTATYTKCKQGTEPATVTMNGCDYDFTFTDGKVGLICPTGKVVEIHRYSSTPHGSSTCTTTVKPTQEVSASHAYTTVHTASEYSSVTYKNVANGDVEVSGTVGGITAQAHGGCSFGFTVNTSEAIFHAGVVVGATNAEGVPVNVHVG